MRILLASKLASYTGFTTFLNLTDAQLLSHASTHKNED